LDGHNALYFICYKKGCLRAAFLGLFIKPLK
jgi:hypothetical protein